MIFQMIKDKYLANSKCANDYKQKLYLLALLGNKKIVTYLRYRGSEHRWKPKDFHDRCDNKGPTISLFKIKDGDCIGGYTNAQWSSDDDRVVDSGAILFNLSQQRVFPNVKKGKAIKCDKETGPLFTGGGDYELCAANEPFNGEGNCSSWANWAGYNIARENGKNMLTNMADGPFTITELEVWEVEFIE